jgi:hypothetical protein
MLGCHALAACICSVARLQQQCLFVAVLSAALTAFVMLELILCCTSASCMVWRLAACCFMAVCGAPMAHGAIVVLCACCLQCWLPC